MTLPNIIERNSGNLHDQDTGELVGYINPVTGKPDTRFPGGGGGGGGTTDLAVSQSTTDVTVASSTGADATIPAATAALAGVMSAADKTKLNGVATGATANSTDAQLRDRATHTGTQVASTISDFTEAAQDAAAALLTSGVHTNVTATYDDANNRVNLAVTGVQSGPVNIADVIGADREFATLAARDTWVAANQALLGAETSAWWHLTSYHGGAPALFPAVAEEMGMFKRHIVGKTVTRVDAFQTNWKGTVYLKVFFSDGSTLNL